MLQSQVNPPRGTVTGNLMKLEGCIVRNDTIEYLPEAFSYQCTSGSRDAAKGRGSLTWADGRASQNGFYVLQSLLLNNDCDDDQSDC